VGVRLTDQAAVAVAFARAEAAPAPPTVAHLLVGLATEPEGRAGRRLRERATAAAALRERAGAAPAPALDVAVRSAAERAGRRAASTVDLLDAAVAAGGDDVLDLLDAVGYHRDLDGWLLGDPDDDWFEDPETYGFDPRGDVELQPAAARIVAQVRAVDGGAVDVLIAAAAAPDGEQPLAGIDPATLAAAARRLTPQGRDWDRGLETVIVAARTLSEGAPPGLVDLVRAAVVAGGDAPRAVLAAVDAQ